MHSASSTEPCGRWSLLKRWHCWQLISASHVFMRNLNFDLNVLMAYYWTYQRFFLMWTKWKIYHPRSHSVKAQTALASAGKSVSGSFFTTGTLKWCSSQFCEHLVFCLRCLGPCAGLWAFSSSETQLRPQKPTVQWTTFVQHFTSYQVISLKSLSIIPGIFSTV